MLQAFGVNLRLLVVAFLYLSGVKEGQWYELSLFSRPGMIVEAVKKTCDRDASLSDVVDDLGKEAMDLK